MMYLGSQKELVVESTIVILVRVPIMISYCWTHSDDLRASPRNPDVVDIMSSVRQYRLYNCFLPQIQRSPNLDRFINRRSPTFISTCSREGIHGLVRLGVLLYARLYGTVREP